VVVSAGLATFENVAIDCAPSALVTLKLDCRMAGQFGAPALPTIVKSTTMESLVASFDAMPAYTLSDRLIAPEVRLQIKRTQLHTLSYSYLRKDGIEDSSEPRVACALRVQRARLNNRNLNSCGSTLGTDCYLLDGGNARVNRNSANKFAATAVYLDATGASASRMPTAGGAGAVFSRLRILAPLGTVVKLRAECFLGSASVASSPYGPHKLPVIYQDITVQRVRALFTNLGNGGYVLSGRLVEPPIEVKLVDHLGAALSDASHSGGNGGNDFRCRIEAAPVVSSNAITMVGDDDEHADAAGKVIFHPLVFQAPLGARIRLTVTCSDYDGRSALAPVVDYVTAGVVKIMWQQEPPPYLFSSAYDSLALIGRDETQHICERPITLTVHDTFNDVTLTEDNHTKCTASVTATVAPAEYGDAAAGTVVLASATGTAASSGSTMAPAPAFILSGGEAVAVNGVITFCSLAISAPMNSSVALTVGCLWGGKQVGSTPELMATLTQPITTQLLRVQVQATNVSLLGSIGVTGGSDTARGEVLEAEPEAAWVDRTAFSAAAGKRQEVASLTPQLGARVQEPRLFGRHRLVLRGQPIGTHDSILTDPVAVQIMNHSLQNYSIRPYLDCELSIWAAVLSDLDASGIRQNYTLYHDGVVVENATGTGRALCLFDSVTNPTRVINFTHTHMNASAGVAQHGEYAGPIVRGVDSEWVSPFERERCRAPSLSGVSRLEMAHGAGHWPTAALDAPLGTRALLRLACHGARALRPVFIPVTVQVTPPSFPSLPVFSVCDTACVL
jgi:hypothetical protein